MHHLIKIVLVILILALASCAGTNPKREKTFDLTMKNIEQLTRWNEIEGVMNLIDPEYLAENEISDLDIARMQQFKIFGYTVNQKQMSDDLTQFRQTVVLQMYNKHNPVERQVRWYQEWRYNPETKRWTMFSGLPDLSQR